MVKLVNGRENMAKAKENVAANAMQTVIDFILKSNNRCNHVVIQPAKSILTYIGKKCILCRTRIWTFGKTMQCLPCGMYMHESCEAKWSGALKDLKMAEKSMPRPVVKKDLKQLKLEREEKLEEHIAIMARRANKKWCGCKVDHGTRKSGGWGASDFEEAGLTTEEKLAKRLSAVIHANGKWYGCDRKMYPDARNRSAGWGPIDFDEEESIKMINALGVEIRMMEENEAEKLQKATTDDALPESVTG